MRQGLQRVATEEDDKGLKKLAERLYKEALGRGMQREAAIFKYCAEQIIVHGNEKPFLFLGQMNKMPVTIDEFMDSPEFLKDRFTVWPTLREDLRAMNPDVFIGEEPVNEVLLGGATGTGKTHLSQASIMYAAYLFSCFDTPQTLYHLIPSTPLVFQLQSVSPTVTKRVIYQPLRATFVNMPYVKKWLGYDEHLESELKLDNGVTISPAAASLQSLVGQAIPGAILDEVNFMTIVENSKQVAGPGGMGGYYNQAEVVYTNISRRRKRSFLTKGFSIGKLCMVSSTRYEGDFLDSRIDDVRKYEESNILTMRRKQYDVAPQDRYSGERFRVLIGSEIHPTKVLEDWEVEGRDFPEGSRIEMVPVELRTDFLKDPEAAQRDYIGIATGAITPFIRRRQKINDATERGRARGLKPLVTSDLVDLFTDGMPEYITENMPRTEGEKRKSRWIHVDLSRVEDRCGIGMVRLDGFVNQKLDPENEESAVEAMPRLTVEMAVGIQPSPAKEIDAKDVRAWIMRLITDFGLNIEAVTYDGFDSQESIQTFRKMGVHSELLSVDRGTAPYDATRDGLYEDRLDIQEDCNLLTDELRTIEYYAEKNKIDHPPRGTKDVSDGVSGAVYKALKSRQVRNGMMVMDSDATEEHADTGVKVRRERMRRPHLPRRR